jgi:hypothetical protein
MLDWPAHMSRRVVIDGSNIATEGRTLPSLAQLRDAVAAFRAEYPDDVLTVVVDATFSYRIPEDERAEFEVARTSGELVQPPAGAIGRGDGFLLQIADRTDATVLSNDSFQEYHGEYEWLFERGRLVGGTPVPGVGWIFTLRTPVRGPRSREAVKEAKRKKRATAAPIEEAIAEAARDALDVDGTKKRGRSRRRRAAGPPPEALNEPMPFLAFVAAHPLGTEVEGLVDHFSSHGAFVTVGDARCYVPLTAMGDPPPRSAREVLARGETRSFVLQALDAQRRGIELALPGHAKVAAGPTEETVEAEIEEGASEKAARKRARRAAAEQAAAERAEAAKAGPEPAAEPAEATEVAATTRKRAAGKAAAGKAATKKAAPAKKAPATKKAATPRAAKKAAPAKKASATKKAATKAAKKAAPAKKAVPAKKAAAKKAVPAKQTARSRARATAD